MIDTVLFDLDGTLLWMDEQRFIQTYFTALKVKFEQAGFQSSHLLDFIWSGLDAVRNNLGAQSNESAFWERFLELSHWKKTEVEPLFLHFYNHEFSQAQNTTKPFANAFKLLNDLHSSNIRLILATNPIFPEVATKKRIGWAGLDPSCFSWITTMENSFFAKPHPGYYQAILSRFSIKPEQCMMVGNDEKEDMIAGELGIITYLVIDCLIPESNKTATPNYRGTFSQMDMTLRSMLCRKKSQ